jgi:hypothetical protein
VEALKTKMKIKLRITHQQHSTQLLWLALLRRQRREKILRRSERSVAQLKEGKR